MDKEQYTKYLKKRPYRRYIAVITIVFFMFSVFSGDILQAQIYESITRENPLKNNVSKAFDINSFSLPGALGEIDYFSSGEKVLFKVSDYGHTGSNKPEKTVIHIQDAHCNYDAQKRIAEIIEYLNERYGINTVNLEGGTGKYDLSGFTKIKDSLNRELLTDRLVKDGVLSGAEYLAANNKEKIKLWGVEDVGLYLKDLRVYRDSLSHKENIERHIFSIKRNLNMIKREVYSIEMLEFEKMRAGYEKGTICLKEYIAYLTSKAVKKGIKTGRNIDILRASMETEEDIDFKAAEKEREYLLDALYQKLSSRELKDLMMMTAAFKAERVTPVEYYRYLIGKTGTTNINAERFKDLGKYIEYVIKYDTADISRIMPEIDKLAARIKERLFAGKEDRILSEMSDYMDAVKDLFEITMMREKYDHYSGIRNKYTVKNILSFISKAAGIKNTYGLGEDTADLQKYIDDMNDFYEYSFRRDEVFIKRLRFGDNTPDVTILITGGFHSANLAELLAEKDINYISIVPRFSNSEEYKCPYFSLLSENSGGILRFLRPGVSMISIYSYLCGEYSRAVYGVTVDDVRSAIAYLRTGEGHSVTMKNGELTLVVSHDRPEGAEELPVASSDRGKIWAIKKGPEEKREFAPLPGVIQYEARPEVMTEEAATGERKSIIDPKNVLTGRDFSDLISDALVDAEFYTEKAEEYEDLLYTGYRIFKQYSRFLNAEGIAVMNEFERSMEEVSSGKFDWHGRFHDFLDLMERVPTVFNPHDELFVDINLTPEQMRLLLKRGYQGFFNIQLTGGACPNQCEMCGVGKVKGPVCHMPFPLIAKILRKVEGKDKKLIPYFRSDPLFYHDSVINATIIDVLRFSRREAGFSPSSLTTHGLPGKDNEVMLESIMGYYSGGMSISFHMYHSKVVSCFIEEYKNRRNLRVLEKTERDKKAIIESQKRRYIPIIKELIESDTEFDITVYRDLDREVNEILRREYPHSLAVLKRILMFQNEVFSIIADEIKSTTGVDLNSKKIIRHRNKSIEHEYIKNTHIIWTDDAISLLRKMIKEADGIKFELSGDEEEAVISGSGMPGESGRFRRTIEAIHEVEQRSDDSIVKSFYSLLLTPERTGPGREYEFRVKLQGKENSYDRFRTVREIFGGDKGIAPDRMDEFLKFLDYLRLMRFIDHKGIVGDPVMRLHPLMNDRGAYENLADSIQKDLRSSLADMIDLISDKRGGRDGNDAIKGFFDNMTLAVNEDLSDYFLMLYEFFVDREKLFSFLDSPGANAEKLYDLLENVPFPMRFFGLTAFSETTNYQGDLADFSSDRAALKKDIYHSFREFMSPVQVTAESLSGTVRNKIMPGLIGKLIDDHGNILENIASAREIGGGILEITGENMEPVHVKIDRDLRADEDLISPERVFAEIERFISEKRDGIPDGVREYITVMIRDIMIHIRDNEIKEVVPLEENSNVKGAFGRDIGGDNVIFLERRVIENPLAVLHELGEGYLALPGVEKDTNVTERDKSSKYDETPDGEFTRHTLMRGAGKGVREALNAVLDEGEEFSGPGDVVTAIEEELSRVANSPGKYISETRKTHKRLFGTYVYAGERKLIEWNFSGNNVRGRELVYGVQDYLDPAGNIRFTEGMRLLKDDMRRGTLNLFLIPDAGEAGMDGMNGSMFTIHKNIERKFRKEMGINTHVVSFGRELSEDEFREKLEYMFEIAIDEKNAEALPKICVDCPSSGHITAVKKFIEEKQSEYPGINVWDLFGIANDPLSEGDIADEVKIIMVGSALMDDRRLKDAYGGKPHDGYFISRRIRMINFMAGNNMLEPDFDLTDPEEIDKVIENIWKGLRSLYITKINWEALREWKTSQDKVLMAL